MKTQQIVPLNDADQEVDEDGNPLPVGEDSNLLDADGNAPINMSISSGEGHHSEEKSAGFLYRNRVAIVELANLFVASDILASDIAIESVTNPDSLPTLPFYITRQLEVLWLATSVRDSLRLNMSESGPPETSRLRRLTEDYAPTTALLWLGLVRFPEDADTPLKVFLVVQHFSPTLMLWLKQIITKAERLHGGKEFGLILGAAALSGGGVALASQIFSGSNAIIYDSIVWNSAWEDALPLTLGAVALAGSVHVGQQAYANRSDWYTRLSSSCASLFSRSSTEPAESDSEALLSPDGDESASTGNKRSRCCGWW
ncbi:MAG: hypothetical protein V3V61_05225 [Gammaproteobacteria bacterium]